KEVKVVIVNEAKSLKHAFAGSSRHRLLLLHGGEPIQWEEAIKEAEYIMFSTRIEVSVVLSTPLGLKRAHETPSIDKFIRRINMECARLGRA
ncbi:hypothetical protein PFISCL1PPCAC_23948, partial [Pristionchus fissidentatus]